MTLRIGDRVRSVSSGRIGTVYANEYRLDGVAKVAVTWDEIFGAWAQPVSNLIRVPSRPSVPESARPLSSGALASPERRFP